MADILIGTNFGEGNQGLPSNDGDLSSQIAAVAAGPKQASADGQSVTSQSIDDLIKADKYLTAKRNGRRGGIGIGVFRSPGAVGDAP